MDIFGAFFGSAVAYKFAVHREKSRLKKERISHINYLLITFHSYKDELRILCEKIEDKLEAIDHLLKSCTEEHRLPNEINDDLLRTRSNLYYIKPLTINTTNFSFVTNNPDFLISLVEVLRIFEDLSHGLKLTNNFSMSFEEKYKDEEPTLPDFINFLKVAYDNHRVLKRKICESVCSINNCKKNLIKINKKFLKYKLIDIAFKDDLLNFLDRCQKFVNHCGV